MKTANSKNQRALLSITKILKYVLVGMVCGWGLLSTAYAQVIVNLDLGNNALASNGAGFTKLGIASGDYATHNGSYYLWTNVANSGLSITMTNIAEYGGTGTLDADGFYNMAGNGPAYFTISNVPPGMPVTLYACWAWNGASHAPIIFFGGTQITVTNNGEMANPNLLTLQNVGTATASANGTVSGYWYGDEGGTPVGYQEGQIGALIINVGPCRPVVSMNGANPIGVQINTPFIDPGATALETCGNSATLTTNGTVNTAVAGAYTLTYSAVSAADNATNTATRMVNVWSTDALNLDLAESGDSISTPAGFARLNWANSNPLVFSLVSVNGSSYTVGFTNLNGTYSFNNYNTLDQDGYYVNGGVTAGFYLSGLPPGDVATLYACWGWNGATDPAVITYGGSTQTLNVGVDITAPSTSTFMQVGSAVADSTGTVRGTWTGLSGKQGQVGGMIFSISAPGGFTVSPTAITNNCHGSATFTATAAVGATNYQWYNPLSQPIPQATNTTLALTNTLPSDSGSYVIVETGPGWASTNSVTLLTENAAPPLMTLNGNSTVLLTPGSAYTELGATAYDTCAENSLPVTTNGTVNTSVSGEYDITYSAITSGGVMGSLTRAVVMINPAATVPGVSLNLDFGAETDTNAQNPITIPAGWTLLAYGDLYQSPNIWGSPSFPNPGGNNPGLTLSFGNISGWSTASGETTGANSSAVVGISTNGFFNYGSKGSDLPATFTLSGVPAGECVSIYAVEGWNGASLAPVITYGGQTTTVTASSVDASPAIGEFQYVGTAIATNGIVTGSWAGIGGPTVEGDLGGMIIQIQSIPLNNLAIAPSSIAAQCGTNLMFTASVYGLPPISYQWYDKNTNAIPGATNASFTVVDVIDTNAGNYTVVAQNGYNSLTNFATIISVLHTAPPVMTLNGANPVNVFINSPYVDAGATAFDLCAQTNLTVTSNSTVNTSVPGVYTVTYSATTADGTPGTIIRTVNVVTTPNFGPNVLVFDPTMTNIQSQLDSVFSIQQNNQFGAQRYALLFKPGVYSNLDVDVGFYTQVLGLGQMPDDTTITGNLHSDGVLPDENATENFWRSAENMDIVPTNGDQIIWAVSQGTSLRRMHIEGTLDLADFTDQNWASGGFLADSEVDDTVSSIAQQQWLSRNDVWGNWAGGVWNMVFVGVSNPPVGTWPSSVYTVVTNTPLIREKPYLSLDTNGNYVVMVPNLETNSLGITWAAGPTPAVSIPINQFYMASAQADNAASINAALSAGLNLILTPGVYQLTDSLQVTRPDTIIMGLGFATLVPQTGTPAMVISDVNGVNVSGLIFDAGPVQSPALLQVASTNSALNHSSDPTFLYDISMRVGGATPGTTASCLQINANDTVGDNLWMWRADHGNGVGWTENPCNNGLIVNGDRVTIYGLFVEHHEQYQTLWNGNWGRLYFYQSEMPYDPPSQAAWSHDGIDGYASYKVADSVTSHQAYGLGIYGVFIDCTNISSFDAIETPTNSEQVNVHDMITVYIGGNTSGNGISAIYSIINGTGPALFGPGFGGTATANCLWLDPTFYLNACPNGSNISLSLPTESWHSYQLQYKNALTDPSWSNLGSLFGGNDTLETIPGTNSATSGFYQVVSY
jgi:hypothetical protein